MPQYEIDISKKYDFPREIKVIQHNDKFIVIAPTLATWIVLDTNEQVSVFNYLHDRHTINEALCNATLDNRDVSFVVTQIEARRLYNKTVNDAVDGERNLHLYLTNRCNLACPHCYMFSGVAKQNELTTDEVIKLLVDYKEITKGEHITLSGGEPSSRSDFGIIVRKAAELGLKVKVLTNGTILNNKLIEELADYIDSIQISIDGFSEESNSIIRGKGSFDKALNAVDICLSHNVPTEIAITPTLELLRGHSHDYLDFAVTLSEKYSDRPLKIKFSEELLSGRDINTTKEVQKEYLSIMQDIQKQLYGPNYDVMVFVKGLGINKLLQNCMFGVFSVTADGNVFLCPRIGNLKPIANIRTSSFKDICEMAKQAERATVVTKLLPCKKCELRYICGGGCRIEEFPLLVGRASFKEIDYVKVARRVCGNRVKERFYDLMIRSNKYFFTALDY